jgi:hypothetical protein
MSQLYRALDVYCASPKQQADQTLLRSVILNEHSLVVSARNYVCKNITRWDLDRYETIKPYKQNVALFADMIILLYVNNGVGRSSFNLTSFTTDGSFFHDAAKCVRKHVDRSRPKRPPQVRNHRRNGSNQATTPGNAAINQRLVKNVTQLSNIEARPDRTPVDERWIRERIPDFEKEAMQYLKDERGDRQSACNDANLLIACALAKSMGVCRYFTRDSWQTLVNNARWFFVEQARALGKTDEEVRMRATVELLCRSPIPEQFNHLFLEKVRIKQAGGRINRVENVVLAKIRELHSKYGFDLENP